MISFYIPRIHISNSNEFIAEFLSSKLTEQLGYPVKVTRIDHVADKSNRHFMKCFVYTDMTELPNEFKSFTFYLPSDYSTNFQSIYWILYRNQNALSDDEKEIADNIADIEEHIFQIVYELTEQGIGIPNSIVLPELNEEKVNVTENKMSVLIEKEKEMNKMRIDLISYANRVLVDTSA